MSTQAPRARGVAPEAAAPGTPSDALGRFGPFGRLLGRSGTALTSPWAVLGVVLAMLLAIGWQFISDAARAVPALDTAWYQWRVEFLQANDPGLLIDFKGAQGALAGGYRIAEPALGALMRTVGGVGPETPTIVLSVLFRVLAAVGIAAYTWQHRRSWSLFYVTLVVVPAVFLLQQFFGFLDNFFALALMAGVLLLMGRLGTSWLARIAVLVFMVLAGLSHPTTLILFLLSMGAVAAYRLLRERSLRAVLASHAMPVLWVGLAAAIIVGGIWLVGIWGPSSSFGEAAVPPPQDRDFFVNRSLNVLEGMYPYILIPILVLGLGALLVALFRRNERFSEVMVAWNLPLVGTLGFLVGAAYPYFRFFNATLAPLVAIAIGFASVVALALLIRRGILARLAPIVAVGFVVVVLLLWWSTGLSSWNNRGTWLTPDVRETMDAADAYMATQPPGANAVFVVEERPGKNVVYSKYKDFANAISAGMDGERVAESFLFFGRIEDLEAGRASAVGDEQYDGIAADTANGAEGIEGSLEVLRQEANRTVVFLPLVFNENSDNGAFVEGCDGCERLTDRGLHVVPELSDAPLSQEGMAAARTAAEDARAFVADPPGPLSDLGGLIVSIIRVGLLLVVPGWLFYQALPDRRWLEAIALVPLLSIGAVTAVAVVLVALVRDPFTAGVGWASWAMAVAVGAALWWATAGRASREARDPARETITT